VTERLAVRGGLVVVPGGAREGDVLIEGERIVAVTEPGEATAGEEIDARGCIVLPGAAESFPRNAIDYALENNLFAEKAYPQQSEHAFATYQSYVDRGRKIPNLRYVGRHAEFKYWGMPETVNAAYQKALAFEPV